MKNCSGQTALLIAVENGLLPCGEELAKLEGVDWNTMGLEDIARCNNKVNILQYFEKRKLGTPAIAPVITRAK